MENWQKKKLFELLDYEQPNEYIVSETNYNDNHKTPVLTAGQTFILGYTNEKHGVFKKNLPVIIFDDFTTAIKFVDFEFKVKSSAMKILKAKKGIANIKYLFYLMQNIKFKNIQHKRYWISEYSQLQVNIHSLSEQERIVSILDKANEIKEKKQKANAQLDTFLKSTFLDLFGDPGLNPNSYPIVIINDIADKISDIGSNGSNELVSKNLVMSDEEDYAYMIRTLNFNQKNILDNMKYVSKQTYDFFKKSQVFGNEIIMCKIGSAGKFWLMPVLDKPVSLGLNQFFIRFKENVNREFIFYCLNTSYCINEINFRISGAVTKSITKGAIRTIPIIYPPLDLQNKFAQIVEKVEQQKQKNEKELEQIDNLINSLMQKAFKGEL